MCPRNRHVWYDTGNRAAVVPFEITPLSEREFLRTYGGTANTIAHPRAQIFPDTGK